MQNIADISILIVDDEDNALSALKRLLRKEPYKIHVASNGQEALEMLELIACKVVITDLRMPEISGLELIQQLKTKHPDIIRVILSGTEDIAMIIDAINAGEVFRFISKPVEPELLKRIIKDCIDYYFLKTERRYLQAQLELNNKQLSWSNESLAAMTEELRERETEFRSMNDAALDPIFMIDQEGFICYTNNAAKDLFGFTDDELRSIKFKELIAQESDGTPFIDFICDFAPNISEANNKHPVKRFTALKKDTSQIPMEATMGSVIIDGVCKIVIIARDITSRIREEKSRTEYERMQQELEAQIEKKLLQGRISTMLKKVSISRLMIPSGHLDGDFTAMITYSEKLIDLVIGDVMGHGVMSALIGAGLKSLIMKISAQKNFQHNKLALLQDIVAGVHEEIITELIELETYATATFLRIDLDAEQITTVDCGHNPTIHFNARTKKRTLIKGHNLPIGLIEQTEYCEVSYPIEMNDLIVLVSDGLTESRSPDNRLFGIERVSELILIHHELEPSEIVEKIHKDACAFTGRNTFDDDLTCIVIRIGNQDLHNNNVCESVS
ncbi:MAG: SpoIIE family protein phosphatase [Chlorobiaceae bacterium]|nr:SpoIIE family protein phosphatase [Chlorobiaceae bacterium]